MTTEFIKLMSDSFTGADGTSVISRPPDFVSSHGGAWEHPGGAEVKIYGNRAGGSVSGQDGRAGFTYAYDSTHCKMVATIVPPGAGITETFWMVMAADPAYPYLNLSYNGLIVKGQIWGSGDGYIEFFSGSFSYGTVPLTRVQHTITTEYVSGSFNVSIDAAEVFSVVTGLPYNPGRSAIEIRGKSPSYGLLDDIEVWGTVTITPPTAPTLLTATCTSGIGETTLPGVPVTSFSADATSGLAPLTVQFTDRSTGTPTSWLWESEAGTLSTSQNPSLIFAEGTHTVRLTATNAQGSSSYQMTIMATTTPVVTPPDDGVVTKSGSVQGNLGMIGYYTVDTGNHQVKIHSTAGALLKTAGSGTPGDGEDEFFMPTSVSVVNGRQRLDRVTISEE